MKKKHLIIIPLAVAAIALAGCSNDSKKVVDLNLHYVTANSVPAGQTDANAQAQLAQAATSVDNSLNQLSAIQMATHPKAKMPAPLNAQAVGMNQVSSLSWTGPAEPVLRRIASAAGYRLRVIGNTPATPPIVQMNAHNETLADMLRNVEYQIEGKARIAVYPSSRVIELRYVS